MLNNNKFTVHLFYIIFSILYDMITQTISLLFICYKIFLFVYDKYYLIMD